MVLAEPAAPALAGRAAGRGHYESYYLRAVDPAGRRGVWIRYTVSVSPGGRAGRTAVVHAASTGRRPPRAPSGSTRAGRRRGGSWIRLGDSAFGARPGSAGTVRRSASWSLAPAATAEQPLRAPPPRLDVPRAAPPHQAAVPAPVGRVRRRVEVDGETVDVARLARRWSGTTGASSTPSRGSGCPVSAFEGAGPDTWLDVARRPGPARAGADAVGRQRRGQPGRRAPLRLGGLGRRVSVDAAATTAASLRLPGPRRAP